MGFGNHEWEYINPADIPTDFGPPGGVASRDFNNAFNKPNPDTDVDIDIISRPGAVIETSAEDYPGVWQVLRMPQYKDGVLVGYFASPTGETKIIPLVSLGVIADRHTNLYMDSVITRRISGGKANKDTREALTKKTEGTYP